MGHASRQLGHVRYKDAIFCAPGNNELILVRLQGFSRARSVSQSYFLKMALTFRHRNRRGSRAWLGSLPAKHHAGSWRRCWRGRTPCSQYSSG